MELSYGDFSLGLHRRISGQRIPIDGTIEITHRCPLRCVHCYNNLSPNDPKAQERELTYREHCHLLDQIAEAGCLWLLFTGGEIFLRGDFLDIYRYGKQKGFLITLYTNGTLITPRVADELMDWPPFSIEIPLYGRTRETYERITRVAGSYDNCRRGIDLLLDRKLPLRLKTLVSALNVHELGEMKKFVEEDLGLKFRFDAMINPRIDGKPGPLEARLKPKEVVALDLQDPKRMDEWKRFAEKFMAPAIPPGKADDLYQCGGGFNSFAIDPYGRMGLCVLFQDRKWDLRKGNFSKGWETFIPRIRRKKVKGWTKCRGCGIKAICGMCPANGLLENRDPAEPVDFLCQVAHLRAKALGFFVKPHGACIYCGVERSSPRALPSKAVTFSCPP